LKAWERPQATAEFEETFGVDALIAQPPGKAGRFNKILSRRSPPILQHLETCPMTEHCSSVRGRRRSKGCLAQCRRPQEITILFRELRFHQKLLAAERRFTLGPCAHLGVGRPLEEAMRLAVVAIGSEHRRKTPAADGDLVRTLAALGQLPTVLKDQKSVLPLTTVREEAAEFEQRRRRRVVAHGPQKVIAGQRKIGAEFRFGSETKEAPCDEIRSRRAASSSDHTCSPVRREASEEARECDGLTRSEFFAILPELRDLSTGTENQERRLKAAPRGVRMRKPLENPRSLPRSFSFELPEG
jgi:hypothetical protein